MTRETLLDLCTRLAEAGIWIALTEEGTLTVGPKQVVTRQKALLEEARAAKQGLMALLEDTLVHDLFLTQSDDPRFATEVCPDCGRVCHIIAPPRRLVAHRLPDGKTLCLGSERAQHNVANDLLGAFLTDNGIPRAQAILTWTSLKGALESWCRERGFLLPPRPYIVAWMDGHFDRHGDDERPGWVGLTLTLKEWGLEENTPASSETEPVLVRSRQRVLTAQ